MFHSTLKLRIFVERENVSIFRDSLNASTLDQSLEND